MPLRTGDQRLMAHLGRWTVSVSPAGGGPVVAFESRMHVEGTPRTEVESILVPENWTVFNPPWGAMTPLASPGPAINRYLETFALSDVTSDLDTPTALRTVLDFRRSSLPCDRGSVLEYRLAENQKGHGGDGRVTVDEGSIVVRDLGKKVDVLTTKRVQFRVFSNMTRDQAASLAMLASNLGFAALPPSFIERIAGVDPTMISIVDASTSEFRRPGNSSTTGSAQSRPPPPMEGIADHPIDAIQQTLTEYRDRLGVSFARLLTGGYGPKDYFDDLRLPLELRWWDGPLSSDPEHRRNPVGEVSYRCSEMFDVGPCAERRVLVSTALRPGLARHGHHEEAIRADLIEMQPDVLEVGETSFRLMIDAGKLEGAPGATYWGHVIARINPDLPSPDDITIPVWLVIP